jgi:hypothetical protein
MIHACTSSARATFASQQARARVAPRTAAMPMRAQRTMVAKAQAQAQAQAPMQQSSFSRLGNGWRAHRAAMAPLASLAATVLQAGAQFAGRQLALLLATLVAMTSYLSIQQLQLPNPATSTSAGIQIFAEPVATATAPTAGQAHEAHVEVGYWAMLAEGGNAC